LAVAQEVGLLLELRLVRGKVAFRVVRTDDSSWIGGVVHGEGKHDDESADILSVKYEKKGTR